jgi:hypothetical protein
VKTSHMDQAPKGTVRRSAEGALLVREFRGDSLGWKLVRAQSDDCEFIDDQQMDPAWLEWPIIWCPEAGFHEQDNIRRAQGEPPMSGSGL